MACFGVVLAVALVGRAILDADRRWSRALQLVGGLALLTILLAALPRLAGPGTEAHEDGHAHEADVAHAEATLEVAADPLASPDPLVRQEAIDRLVVEVSDGSTRALLAHLPVEEDDELRLRVATALHVRGVTEGTVALGALAEGADIPFVRLTAQAELEGEPPVK